MKTSDIWFASFLKLKGFEIIDYEVIHKAKGRYKFNISEDEWKELKMQFEGSDASKLKMIQISLKDLLY